MSTYDRHDVTAAIVDPITGRSVPSEEHGWYVLVDREPTTQGHGAQAACLYGERVRFVHVMSPHAGGEVRGYTLHGGVLWLRAPCYQGAWPEVDAIVGAMLGADVKPCRVSLGGGVSFDVPEKPTQAGQLAFAEVA